MYIYDEIDQRLVDERVEQFRDQTRGFLIILQAARVGIVGNE